MTPEYISEHNRYHGLDPLTLEPRMPTDEEKNWHKIIADGPVHGDVITNAKFLHDAGIHDWYWVDRAPDRMVWRTTLYFKHEKDLMFFKLGRL